MAFTCDDAAFNRAVTAVAAKDRCVLAFDTANEVIALGVGVLNAETKTIRCVHSEVIEAHRASNTQLIPSIDRVLSQYGITRAQVSCVVCGRGPGSFTGVRIALATAKGIAHALGVALVGVSTLDAIAWGAQVAGVRGTGAVVADAMRREVYPVRFRLSDGGVERLDADAVVKAQVAAERLSAAGRDVAGAVSAAGDTEGADACAGDGFSLDFVTGDALRKYREFFEPVASVLDQGFWTPSGRGLLFCAQSLWMQGKIDPFDAARHNPSFTLPVYTRLSDAEENERMVLPKRPAKNLTSGVQGESIIYKPLDARRIDAVRALDAQAPCKDELKQATTCKTTLAWLAFEDDVLVGYVFGAVANGVLEVRRVFTLEQSAYDLVENELLAHMASDARDLGATEYRFAQAASCSAATADARATDVSVAAETAPLARLLSNRDVAGMDLRLGGDMVAAFVSPDSRPLIFALESSCDETAAAIVDGQGEIIANVVASQIDFHSRFGGVVPEIASRKHIEAICGVCDACFEQAAEKLEIPSLTWHDMNAVAVTYAPGLVGALVVGVAFAKGAAWAADKPFIGVNHLEGHLYANKIGAPDLRPPLVASLVSGGNTMLVHVKDWGNYTTLGTTLDDAVGEAFDKVAKALGLGYPGGPAISAYAAKGNPNAIAFPRAMMHSGDLQFSLSGLKTAVITYIHQEEDAGRELNLPDIAASFQAAVVDVQVAKAKTALEMTGAKEFCLGGGVAANPALREAYRKMCDKMDVRLTLPPLSVCGDNGAMIALVALDRYRQGKFFDLSCDALAHTNLDEPY